MYLIVKAINFFFLSSQHDETIAIEKYVGFFVSCWIVEHDLLLGNQQPKVTGKFCCSAFPTAEKY